MRTIDWAVEWPSQANTRAEGQIEVDDNATDDEIGAMVLEEIQNYVTWGWSQADGDSEIADGEWPNVNDDGSPAGHSSVDLSRATDRGSK